MILFDSDIVWVFYKGMFTFFRRKHDGILAADIMLYLLLEIGSPMFR